MKKTNRLLSILLVLLLLCTSIPLAFASTVASGTCGENLTWTLDDAGTLTISGTGKMWNRPWNDLYTDQIKSVVISEGVTSIAKAAFINCSNLRSVTIPNSVSKIGSSAFYGCSKLERVTIPYGITSIEPTTFSACHKLASVSIPNTVTTIGRSAFWACESLTSVVIPDSVTTIGDDAFWQCLNLTNLSLGNSINSIGEEAFKSCPLTTVTIPSGVENIAKNAFSRCESFNVNPGNPYYSSDTSGCLYNKEKTILLKYPIGNSRTSFVVPNTVKRIENYAFY